MPFMEDIGEIVAQYCGGDINGVSEGSYDKDTYNSPEDEYTQPTLSVWPNDSLPSLTRNVWSMFDHESDNMHEQSEADEHGIELGSPWTAEELEEINRQMNAMLLDRPIRLCAHVERGFLESVITRDLPESAFEIRAIDYRMDCDEEKYISIKQSDGSVERALCISVRATNQAAINLDDVFGE